jgi:ssRNA-specific RNase YbeY (16S rRNA maturation enzyme)
MRVIGIVAVFVLALAAIVEGAVIVRLSTRIDALDEKLAHGPASAEEVNSPRREGVALARGGSETSTAALPPPRLTPTPGSPPPVPTGPATAMLAEALQTQEGRQHLRGAIEHLREQERQDRLIQNAERDVEREQRYRDRLTKVLSLPAHEQEKVGQFYAGLQAGRKKVLEEMRAGLKNAEQADDEIDNLEDSTEQQVRSLLGDQRMQQLREARRAEQRGRGRGQGQQGQQGQQGATPAAPPPPAPPPT